MEGDNDASESQAFEKDMEKDITAEATTGTEASNIIETTPSCMIFDLISDNVFNYSIPQPENKTPTPHYSPNQLSKHTPTPEHDMGLPLGPVMTSPKPFDDSDSITIAQILSFFHTSYILDVLLRYLVGEFSSENPSENNQL